MRVLAERATPQSHQLAKPAQQQQQQKEQEEEEERTPQQKQKQPRQQDQRQQEEEEEEEERSNRLQAKGGPTRPQANSCPEAGRVTEAAVANSNDAGRAPIQVSVQKALIWELSIGILS